MILFAGLIILVVAIVIGGGAYIGLKESGQSFREWMGHDQ